MPSIWEACKEEEQQSIDAPDADAYVNNRLAEIELSEEDFLEWLRDAGSSLVAAEMTRLLRGEVIDQERMIAAAHALGLFVGIRYHEQLMAERAE